VSAALRVAAAGPLSTVQDRGRIGWQRYGVSPAGAFDWLYLAVANALVGNPPAAPGIEFTLMGDAYVVEAESARLAVAGDAAVSIDDQPAEPWRSYRLARGQKLRVRALKQDARGYVAVAGGVALAPVLGSIATHVRTGLGGVEGRKLKAGDLLPLAVEAAPPGPERRFDPALLPARSSTLRVLLGPQDDYFTAEGIETFLSAEYTVTREADRMGYRLEGPAIAHAKGYNIVSDGIPLGAVQVPGSGQPIVMMVDRQTTGGYPKIACVIAPDVAALAQVKPGHKLRFRAIDANEALAARREMADWIAALTQRLAALR
jgi:5-oxoprolinase (ATP-hydrolysing) subunit C